MIIEEVFQEIFVEKYGMLKRRFDEQIKTGNIICEEVKYEMTDRSRGFVKIFKTMSHSIVLINSLRNCL